MNAAFLFGAAAGGLVFGWLGDRIGRVRAMAASIFCFSMFSGIGYLAATPEQLLVLRFLCGSGVGGMWPTGVALASEVWSESSRPFVSGLLGTAANVGLVIFNDSLVHEHGRQHCEPDRTADLLARVEHARGEASLLVGHVRGRDEREGHEGPAEPDRHEHHADEHLQYCRRRERGAHQGEPVAATIRPIEPVSGRRSSCAAWA